MRLPENGIGGYDARDLCGGVPSRLVPSTLELAALQREKRRQSQNVKRSQQRVGEDAYEGPPCDRPATPEALAWQVAHHAPGPGDPGDEAYLRDAGEGLRERYRESAARFLELDRTRLALEAAAEHGSWEAREMILLLLSERVISPREALDLQMPGLKLQSDIAHFAKLVGVCCVSECAANYFSSGLCRTHYRHLHERKAS